MFFSIRAPGDSEIFLNLPQHLSVLENVDIHMYIMAGVGLDVQKSDRSLIYIYDPKFCSYSS